MTDRNKMENFILYYKLLGVNKVLNKRNEEQNPEIKNIGRGQGKIIMILRKKDKISTKDLSNILNISVTSLNETLNKLEQKDIIRKVPSEEDKRILLIELTEKGKDIKCKKPTDLDIFDSLNDEEKANLNEYLNRIHEELRKKLKEEDPEKYERIEKHREEILKKHFKMGINDEDWFKMFEN
ncbi:MAG: MarR family transcriptional regulator [Methanobrevibacter sp.]|nr:MarR family transcriptional regulator [Methanobrevibacter sp.]